MLFRIFALVGVILFAISGVAWAKPKVVVLAFSGDAKEEARRAVVAALADDIRLVSRKAVRRNVDKLELDPEDLSEKDLRNLADELEAEAIIQADLSKKPPNKVLHFKLFVHGKKVTGFTIEFGSLKSKKFRAALRDKIVAKLSEDEGDDKPAKATRDDDAPLRSKKSDGEAGEAEKGDDDVSDALTTKTAKAKQGEDGAEKADAGSREGGEGGEDGKDKPGNEADAKPKARDDAAAPARMANRAAVRLDIGGAVHKRSLKFNARDFPQAPDNYSNSIVPGIRVEAQVYPLAFSNPNSIAAGLGLAGLFDQTLLLKLTPDVQPGTKLPVTERRFSIGPRFRYVFGSSPTSPSITVGVGYAQRTFTVKRSALMDGNAIDLPDVKYVGFDPGLEARIGITGRLAVVLGGSVLLLTSTGAIEKADQFGRATVTAGQGTVGVDIGITSRIGVRLTGEFAQFGFKFAGTGTQSNARDNDASTKDVGGATDRYFSGVATLAVQY